MSNECREARDQIYQYLDAELDEETATSVRTHLDDCPECLESFDLERRLKVVVRRCLTEDIPETLETRVRQLIRRETA